MSEFAACQLCWKHIEEKKHLREHQVKLIEALRELMSICKIHADQAGWNFAWAEMEYAEEVLRQIQSPRTASPEEKVVQHMTSSYGKQIVGSDYYRELYAKLQTQSCMHEQCPNCRGTGTTPNGFACVHNMSCPCPKCTPR